MADKNLLTKLPFGLNGRIFRSPMPYGTYDPDGYVFEAYQRAGVTQPLSCWQVTRNV